MKNIISIPMLDMDGFSFIVENNKCLTNRNKILYDYGTLNNSS